MRLALLMTLAACSSASTHRSTACEPNEPVSAVLSGYAAAGVSDEGFVTDSDIDLTITVRPEGTACW